MPTNGGLSSTPHPPFRANEVLNFNWLGLNFQVHTRSQNVKSVKSSGSNDLYEKANPVQRSWLLPSLPTSNTSSIQLKPVLKRSRHKFWGARVSNEDSSARDQLRWFPHPLLGGMHVWKVAHAITFAGSRIRGWEMQGAGPSVNPVSRRSSFVVILNTIVISSPLSFYPNYYALIPSP
jgi:hypothetical protein